MAKWNKKCIEKLNKPSLDSLACGIPQLMATLESAYQKTNFYKETHVVTFLDFVFQYLLSKIKKEVTIQKATDHKKDQVHFLQTIST